MVSKSHEEPAEVNYRLFQSMLHFSRSLTVAINQKAQRYLL